MLCYLFQIEHGTNHTGLVLQLVCNIQGFRTLEEGLFNGSYTLWQGAALQVKCADMIWSAMSMACTINLCQGQMAHASLPRSSHVAHLKSLQLATAYAQE